MLPFLEFMNAHKKIMVTPEDALAGRDDYPFPLSHEHLVLGTDMLGEGAPEGARELILAGGCFWGIERIMWQIPGVWTTAAVYAGGYTPHPTYEEVCSAKTGHAEAVKVIYEDEASLARVLTEFWQQHDPTTENQQGNDIGTQYRSAIFWTDPAQERIVRTSLETYQEALTAAGRGSIATVVAPLSEAGAGKYYYAEPEHQQYLAKNPGGYCNHGFNGVACSLEGAL
ncbi:peptide-methionine (S)-S-oxide reductase MsrA [Dermabacter vaginalis]|uniref:Peptide methionine sulfoxide reductase MsrA n=1 Tax=Dermabacter vaginalis TaxID=1630135 RepID=A0ABX6A7F4_9MICO|nr:peptide-methionine (S)-S-oxide reductase MsrA [Dermabacter vaginalis]QEU12555.1 peptide-methionine (S)-S-oxide reductase MsrA [Dermabacter vaginalis]